MMLKNWVIIKNGYYYRPHAQGYTSNLSEAGRYTRQEAMDYASVEPERIKAKRISDIKVISSRTQPP